MKRFLQHQLEKHEFRRKHLLMGEAYLMLDRLGDARDVLARLDGECRRVALVFTDGDFRNGCGEYKELKSKIDAYVASGKLPDRW